MANSKIIEKKAEVVSEIKDKFQNASSVVVFDYRGLTVSEVTELRRALSPACTSSRSSILEEDINSSFNPMIEPFSNS